MSTSLVLQPCCGKHHPLPFQHVHVYQDKRGRTRHQYECSRCFRSLPERGLKPANIRWTKRGDPHCETCAEELKREIAAQDYNADASGVFETVQANLSLWARGS